jgi:hypothetical protein
MGRTGITNGEEISKIMKELFGKRFIGIVQWKSTKDVPPLKEGEVVILNKDVHWTAAYKLHGKLYEVDSFNRDLLGSKFKDDRAPASFRQTPTTADCGQRTVSLLVRDLL